MLIVGSVVNIIDDAEEKVVSILKKYKEIEVYSITDDRKRIIIVFEVKGEKELEKICEELKSYDEIIDIGHHYCNFEEAIEGIEKGEITPEVFRFKDRKKINI
ncbi:chaperone NapD [Deferribacteraceae bacterium V6Fe1]|nr:chaperone NapD [Deferribacteraceae bacterium V6Fe1]